MKQTPVSIALALLSALVLVPSAAAAPDAAKVCAGLTQSAQKVGKKADAKAKAEAKGRLALAAAIKKLAKAPENVNEGSKGKGITPLMIATALGEKDAVAWLLSIGADPTIKDAEGKDALSRTEDEELTALLKTGALFSWEEAIAYLENSKDEALKALVELCRKNATNAEGPEYNLVIASAGTDVKLTSFVLRHCPYGKLHSYRGTLNVGKLPKEKRVPMLNLLNAYELVGIGSSRPHDFDANLREDKAVQDWLLKHVDAKELLRWCCIGGYTQLAETALQKAREGAGQDPAEMKKIHSTLAACMTVIGEPVGEEMLSFLMKQDRGGCISYWLLTEPARTGDIGTLRQLLEKEKTSSTIQFEGSEMRPLESSLWELLIASYSNDDTYHYLKAKVESYPPAAPWSKEEAELNKALGEVIEAEEKAIAQGKPADPRRLEIARLLRRHGAQLASQDGSNDWSHDTLKYLKSEGMKKVLLDTEGLSPRSIMITGAVTASKEMFTAGLKQLQKSAKNKDEVHQAVAHAICYAANASGKLPIYADRNTWDEIISDESKREMDREMIDFLLQQDTGSYGVLNQFTVFSTYNGPPTLSKRLKEATLRAQLQAGKAPRVLYQWIDRDLVIKESCATFSVKEALLSSLASLCPTRKELDHTTSFFASVTIPEGDDHGHLSTYLYAVAQFAADENLSERNRLKYKPSDKSDYAEELALYLESAQMLLQQGAKTTCQQGNCLRILNLPEEMRQLLLQAQNAPAEKKPANRQDKKSKTKRGKK